MCIEDELSPLKATANLITPPLCITPETMSCQSLQLSPISETQTQQRTPGAVYPPQLPGVAGLQIPSTFDTASHGLGAESSDRE